MFETRGGQAKNGKGEEAKLKEDREAVKKFIEQIGLDLEKGLKVGGGPLFDIPVSGPSWTDKLSMYAR